MQCLGIDPAWGSTLQQGAGCVCAGALEEEHMGARSSCSGLATVGKSLCSSKRKPQQQHIKYQVRSFSGICEDPRRPEKPVYYRSAEREDAWERYPANRQKGQIVLDDP